MRNFCKTLAAFFLLSCSSSSSLTFDPIEDFELNQYMGKWYEIARLPTRFQRNLSQVTAEYTLQDDGTVKVVNSGYDATRDRWKSAEATAYTTSIPNLLKVSFFPFIKSDYWVIHIDSTYQQALVGGGTRDYLWILARQPSLPEVQLQSLIKLAQRHGYDTTQLIYNR